MTAMGMRSIFLCVGFFSLGFLSCGPEKESWDQGVAFRANRQGLQRQLAEIMEIEGTPAANWAKGFSEDLEDLECPEVEMLCPAIEGCDFARELRCTEGTPERLDGKQPFWRLEVGEPQWRLLVEATAEKDTKMGLTMALDLKEEFSAPWTRLLPGKESPGPARLSAQDALFHARLRPESGLEVSSGVEAGGLADELFNLRNDLFAATMLSGNAELVIYLPEPGQLIPPVALALDVRFRDAGIQAMESLVQDVLETWPVSRRDWSYGGYLGACVDNLAVLPDLAPCYLSTDDFLVVGWNPGSLHKALIEDPSRDEGNFVKVHLDRFPQADRILETKAESGWTPAEYPWSTLHLTGSREEGRYRLQLDFHKVDRPTEESEPKE